MQKETKKQMYSAPSSELLELTQECVICQSTGTAGLNSMDDPYEL